jgi:ABC-type phosphate transport system auxiliary subunit
MAEEIQDPTPPVEGDNVDPNQPKETPDFQAEIEKVKAELTESFKTEIAGLNRKNSELTKELKQKELEGKTEAEQVEALRLEKEKLQKEAEELSRSRIVDKELDSAGLPLDFAKRIIGKDDTEISEDISNFKDLLNKTAQSLADKIVNERLGGVKPEGGSNPAQGGKLTLDEIEAIADPKARRKALKDAGY